MPSMQKTFDKVVNHLRKQGQPSIEVRVEGTVNCLYRGPGGLMCAAGVLIPDADYHPDLEGSTAVDREIAVILEKGGHDVELVAALQAVHDQADGVPDVAKWEMGFVGVAAEFGLRYTPPAIN